MNGLASRAARNASSLARPVYELLVPEVTRDGVEDLWAELWSDTPKDLSFVVRHGKALMPKTVVGWLTALTLFSVLMAVEFAALCSVFVGVGVLLVGGAIGLFVFGSLLNFVLIPSAIVLFCCACFWGLVALGIASAASSLAVASFIWKSLSRIFFFRLDRPIQRNPILGVSTNAPNLEE